MKFLLPSTIILVVCYVAVESAKMVEVSRTRRHFDSHRTKRNVLTIKDIEEEINLGGDVQLKPSKDVVFHSAKGVDRQRVAETYFGLVVKGPHAEVEIEKGQLTGQIYGELADASSLKSDIPDPKACQKDVEDMIDFAVAAEGIKLTHPAITDRKGERAIYLDPNNNDKAYIVYEVEFQFLTKDKTIYPVYTIDACNMTVLLKYQKIITADLFRRGSNESLNNETSTDEVCVEPPLEPILASVCTPAAVGFGGNVKTKKVIYGQIETCLNVQKTDNLCTMENEYVKIIDNEGSSVAYKTQNPVVFKCDLGYRDGINDGHGIANDALFYGTNTFAFFKEKYGIKALPWKPRMVVHYNVRYENAFWNGRDMFFGDGNTRFYPLLDLDVTAHELGHGFTSTNSDLVYSGESGGINEAFSDITGETVQNYVTGSNDWLIGAEIGKSITALRYMHNPPLDGKSAKHVDDYYVGMNVHYSSGIFNYAYYQLVEKMKMPIFQAFECFMEANRVVWGKNTNFVQGACGVVQSCYDEGFDTDKVINAFSVVGISLTDCNITALGSIMKANDTRQIKISSSRKPIIQLGDGGSDVTVDDTNVTIEICSDDKCNEVPITETGSGSASVGQSSGDVWVRVSSNSTEDMTVSMTWE